MKLSVRFLLLVTVGVPAVVAQEESTDLSSISLRGAQQHRRLYNCNKNSICLHRDEGEKCLAWDPDSSVGNKDDVREYTIYVARCSQSEYQKFKLSGGYLKSKSDKCKDCCVGEESGQGGSGFRYLSLKQKCTSSDDGWDYDSSRPCFTKGNKCLHWGGYNVGLQTCRPQYDLHQCWLPGSGVV